MNLKLTRAVAGWLSLFVVITLSACSSNPQEIKWKYHQDDVTGIKPAKSGKIDLDVYLDATTSMEGFAISSSSVYAQFLDQLEASALSAWQNANLKFYKFGQVILPVNRAEYLSAKDNRTFYQQKGVFLKTYIDSVVSRTDTKRLSVLITDLFQDAGDVNTMVDQFKSKCFANGVAIGIVGIKSQFEGKVFDVAGIPAGYALKSSDRPFYAIIFGNQYNMEQMIDALKSKPFVKEEQVLIFSNNVVKEFNATMTKSRESIAISNKKARADIKNSFDFGMKKDGKDAKINLKLDLQRNNRYPDFNEKSIGIVVYKKSSLEPKSPAKDSVTSEDISIENIARTGNSVTATLVLKNSDPAGNYSYLVYLKLNELTGLKVPAWINAFSTSAPVPGTPSASLTYNLEKLASTMLVAQSSVAPSYIGKFYINIYKR